MYVITNDSFVELDIKKSKFLSYSFYVKNVDEAFERLNQIKQEHKKATHVCYGLVLSQPSYEKYDDDGEPAKTAGFPILDMIKKHDVTNILVVVVRYYGGVKLGTGGLIRAYGNGAKEVIIASGLEEEVERVEYQLELPYEEYNVLISDKRFSTVKVTFTEFKDKVYLAVSLERQESESWLEVYGRYLI